MPAPGLRQIMASWRFSQGRTFQRKARDSNPADAWRNPQVVQCWGNNYRGQLGNGSTTDSSAPVAVTGLSSGVAAIAAGYEHTCALLTTGHVKCWGVNDSGQLGSKATPTTDSASPVGVDEP